MFQLLNSLIYAANSPLHILCLLIAWILIAVFAWSCWLAAKDGITTVQRLHQIPCSTCQFFTGSYQLKCPVHPKMALSEEAINCSDYDPKGSQKNYL